MRGLGARVHILYSFNHLGPCTHLSTASNVTRGKCTQFARRKQEPLHLRLNWLVFEAKDLVLQQQLNRAGAGQEQHGNTAASP